MQNSVSAIEKLEAEVTALNQALAASEEAGRVNTVRLTKLHRDCVTQRAKNVRVRALMAAQKVRIAQAVECKRVPLSSS